MYWRIIHGLYCCTIFLLSCTVAYTTQNMVQQMKTMYYCLNPKSKNISLYFISKHKCWASKWYLVCLWKLLRNKQTITFIIERTWVEHVLHVITDENVAVNRAATPFLRKCRVCATAACLFIDAHISLRVCVMLAVNSKRATGDYITLPYL